MASQLQSGRGGTHEFNWSLIGSCIWDTQGADKQLGAHILSLNMHPSLHPFSSLEASPRLGFSGME